MIQIGNYEVEEKPIGSGGMGEVLKGYAPSGLPVALKKILPQFVSDYEYRKRIEQEIKFLHDLDHPNVVKVYDSFTLDGNLFIVMELIEGKNLEQFVNTNGPIPWKDAVKIMTRLLDTLQYVHEHNIVHRDIKPGNIMVKPDGSVCLLDFGVAKALAVTEPTGGTTVLGSVIGTDGYMSPEQANGLSIDHRSDIYALGCVFFFMLTGRHAYVKQASDIETLMSLSKPFPRLADNVKGVPSTVQEVLDKAVDKNMLNRFRSCREFGARLAATLPGGTQIKTGVESNDISVSVGRENCDIVVFRDNQKVSRHHADITRKVFTGGVFYVYTDCSTNGTVIDGQRYSNGMSFNIPRGTYPDIRLAGESTCRLNIRKIAELLDERYDAVIGRDTEIDGGGDDPKEPDGESLSFFGAVGRCFRKYAVFRGCASRIEFWWFALFNMLVTCVIFGIVMAVTPYPESMMLYYPAAAGIWSLITLLPSMAAAVRRLHDTDRSGWTYLWCVLGSVLLVPAIYLIICLAQKSDPDSKYRDNQNQSE